MPAPRHTNQLSPDLLRHLPASNLGGLTIAIVLCDSARMQTTLLDGKSMCEISVAIDKNYEAESSV